MAEEPQPKRARTSPNVFVDDANPAVFRDEHLVNVESPWTALLDHIEEHSIAIIRAPPKSGKTMLGVLASSGRVGVVNDRGYEVRYCNSMANVGNFATRWGFRTVMDMAMDSGESRTEDRKTVVYFFDEAGQIPEEINENFINFMYGYAVFAAASVAQVQRSHITPPEL